jgi:hypothetical protein
MQSMCHNLPFWWYYKYLNSFDIFFGLGESSLIILKVGKFFDTFGQDCPPPGMPSTSPPGLFLVPGSDSNPLRETVVSAGGAFLSLLLNPKEQGGRKATDRFCVDAGQALRLTILPSLIRRGKREEGQVPGGATELPFSRPPPSQSSPRPVGTRDPGPCESG